MLGQGDALPGGPLCPLGIPEPSAEGGAWLQPPPPSAPFPTGAGTPHLRGDAPCPVPQVFAMPWPQPADRALGGCIERIVFIKNGQVEVGRVGSRQEAEPRAPALAESSGTTSQWSPA